MTTSQFQWAWSQTFKRLQKAACTSIWQINIKIWVLRRVIWDLWSSTSPTSCSGQVPLQRQGCVQMGFACLQGWRFHCISGQPVPWQYFSLYIVRISCTLLTHILVISGLGRTQQHAVVGWNDIVPCNPSWKSSLSIIYSLFWSCTSHMFVPCMSASKELHKFRGISILEEAGHAEWTNSLLHTGIETRDLMRCK